ncbi:MAG TPA: hypothetical protein VLA79_20780 [Polyangia bacterium]|nr:hypothetical protein [Polyangia bacterium]
MAVTVGLSAAGSPARARKVSEETQRRALLGQLAAASAEVAPQERTDADLMYEAMRQWHGEPRGSAAVDRALAQSKKDIRLDRKQIEEKVRKMFWKDPFSDEVVPVAKSDRDLLRAHAVRESRVRDDAREDEVARLKAEVSAARAENARLREQLARADGGASSSETVVAQTECTLPSRRLHAGNSSGGHSRRDGGQLEALNAPVHHRRSGSSKPRSQPEAAAEPVVAAAPAETVTGPPAGWQSSDPRGIIVVPITASIRAH